MTKTATTKLYVCQSLRPMVQLTNTTEHSQSREANSPASQFYRTRRFMTVLTRAIISFLSYTSLENTSKV